MSSEQEKKAAMALGAAMLGAMDLLVRRYLGVEETEGFSARTEMGEEIFAAAAGVNESFDMERFSRMQGGQTPAEAGSARAAEDREDFSPAPQPVRAEEGLQARTLSEAIEKDSRRYDGQFYLYE